MELTLRPLDVENDLPRLAELINLVKTEPITADVLRDREAKWSEKGVRQRLVATDATGRIVAYGCAQKRDYEPPDRFGVLVIVDRECRNRGIGSRLFSESEDFARQQGGTRLRAYVRDNDTVTQEFE